MAWHTCLQCGKQFKRLGTTARYCSRVCFHQSTIVTYPKVCEQCGKAFNAELAEARYCSTECYHAATVKGSLLTCKHCGKQVHRTPSRINRGEQYCSRECRSADAPRVVKVCPVCGKTYEVLAAIADRYLTCSKACRLARGGNTKPSPPRPDMLGANNPKYKPKVEVKCAYCGKIFETFPSRLGRRRYCSKTCAVADPTYRGHPKPKITLTCLNCGKQYLDYPCRANRKFCSQHCMGCWTVKHLKGPTSLEVRISDMLIVLGLQFVPQKQLGVYVCDFYLPKGHMVIECDGTYWHSRPEQQAHDTRRDGWMATHGYTVLRLSEDRIKNDPAWCQEQITTLLARCVGKQHSGMRRGQAVHQETFLPTLFQTGG